MTLDANQIERYKGESNVYFNGSSIDFSNNRDNYKLTDHIKSVLLYGKPMAVENAWITICIPTCKRAETIGDTIQSTLNQDTSVPYRVLVLDNDDDFSNDNILNIVKSFESDKISYYKNKQNIFMYGNINRCTTLANTEKIVFLSDDDQLATDYIKTMYKVFAKHPKIKACRVQTKVAYRSNNESLLNEDKFIKQTGNLPAIIGRLIWHLFQRPGKLHRVSMFSNFFDTDPYGNPFGITFDRKTLLDSGGFDQQFFPSPDWTNEIMFHLKYNFYIYREKLYIYYFSPAQDSLRTIAAKENGHADTYPYLRIATYFNLPHYLKNGRLFWKIFGKDFEKFKKYYDTGEKSHYSKLFWIMYYIMINNWQ